MSWAKCYACKASIVPIRMRDGSVINVDGPSLTGGIIALRTRDGHYINGHSAATTQKTVGRETRLARHYCQQPRLHQAQGFLTDGAA